MVSVPSPRGSPRTTRLSVFSRPLFWAALGFVILIVIPLYTALVVVVVRTRLLDLDGSFTDEQYKAIWAFLGVALGTAATILGALLTKSASDRNLAQQQEAESRQKLETAVQALNLMKHDDAYAPKAVTAGALATLVHLGHPTIAMRATEAATKDRAVTVQTAVWLIDQVLRRHGDPEDEALLLSKQEAVWLLETLSPELGSDDSGFFQFPSSAIGAWPKGLLPATQSGLLETMIEVLVSRDAAWWRAGGGSWTWVLCSLDEIVQDPPDDYVRGAAATYGLRLMSALAEGESVGGLTDSREPEEVRARFREYAANDGSHLVHWDAVVRWSAAGTVRAEDDEERRPEPEERPGEP